MILVDTKDKAGEDIFHQHLVKHSRLLVILSSRYEQRFNYF
jgi:hypothetical protein